MDRADLPKHVSPTYVLPQYKAVYVAVSKAACTSLKWLVADLMGEDPERITASGGRAVTRDMCVHNRGRWQHTPVLHRLSDAELAEVHPDNGWFVWTVVRHPGARLFSAWQSKFLLREPTWVEKMGDKPWFPRVPESTEDVVEDFAAFARNITRWPEGQVMRDRHFMPQWLEAAPDRVPYTKVYDTSEIPQLLRDLRAHLATQGHDRELTLKRSNETPLSPIAALYGDDVRTALEQVYADDFANLGYDDPLPPRLAPGDAWDPDKFADVQRLVERHERIGDLARRLAELEEGAQPGPAVPEPLRSPVARMRRALRR